MIQFGHNDGGSLNTGRARGTLQGTGEESEEVIMERDSSLEIVHTYGWYMRRYVTDAVDAGATPIVLSLVPRNRWDDSVKLSRDTDTYVKWAREVAMEEDAFFIDLNQLIADKYDALGPEKVTTTYFLTDHTHTNREGAIINAGAVVEGLRFLKDCTLNGYLLETSPSE